MRLIGVSGCCRSKTFNSADKIVSPHLASSRAGKTVGELLCLLVAGLLLFSPAIHTFAGEKVNQEPKRLEASPEEARPVGEPETEAASESDQRYRLRYKFRANQFVHYDTSHKSTIHMRVADVKETANNEAKTRKHYRVISVDGEGNAVMEMMLDRVWMSNRFDDNEPTTYDSEDPDKRPTQFEHVHKTVGRPLLRVRVDSRGQILEATKLVDDGNPNSQENEVRQNFFITLPEEPLQVGESWKERYEVPVRISSKLTRPVTIQRTYRLVSVENQRATIEFQVAVITPISDPSLKAQLIQRTPSGTIGFDLEQGLIVARKHQLDETVIGISGSDNSSMRAISTFSEKLVPVAEIAREVSDGKSTN